MKNQIQRLFTTTFEMYTFSSSDQRPESQVPIYQDYCFQGIMWPLERVMFSPNKQLVSQCMEILPKLSENKLVPEICFFCERLCVIQVPIVGIGYRGNASADSEMAVQKNLLLRDDAPW